MGFIENMRDAMTRQFDKWSGNSHIGHLSDITPEQKQKWADERASANLKEYNGLQNVPLEIGNANNQTEFSPWKKATNDDVDFAPEATHARYSPVVYEFSYDSPSDADNIDNGKKTKRKGIVFMFDSSRPYGGVSDGRLSGRNLIYGATLADGTTLNADEFKDFIASNSAQGNDIKFGDELFRGKSNDPNYTWRNNKVFRKNALEFYDSNRRKYVDSQGKQARWDTKNRYWSSE